MNKDKVLAAVLTHNAWITFVILDIIAYGLPHILESSCATSEMNTGKVWRVHNVWADLTSGSGNKINNSIRNTRFLEKFH